MGLVDAHQVTRLLSLDLVSFTHVRRARIGKQWIYFEARSALAWISAARAATRSSSDEGQII
jgi:hypothetical protein